MPPSISRRARGQVVILVAVLGGMFFGLAAMSVDLIYAYVVKAKLVSAVDAAALAAARALTLVTGTEAEQEAQLNAIVTKLFTVNFPTGFMLTTDRQWTTPDIVNNADGTRRVSISATAKVPTFFMRLVGYNKLDIGASATAMRRDVNVMLVLDRSGSLVLVSPPAWDDVQAAASFFVNQFDNTRDRLGIVSFGTNARLDLAPATNFKTSALNIISVMQSYSSNRTNSPYGLWMAYQALTALPSNNGLNVIVFFTDGQPTAFVGHHNVVTSSGSSPRCTVSPFEGVYMTDQDGGANNVWGLFRKDATSNPTPNPDYQLVPSSGTPRCTGLSSPSGNNVGNLVTSFRSTWEPNGIGFAPAISLTSPRSVNLNDEDSGNNVKDIAYNLTWNTADLIRQDSRQIRIFSIGLGGYLYPADDDLLQAVANDPASPAYNPNQPTGLYVYAPNQTQLMQAFQRVSSEITRLIQ